MPSSRERSRITWRISQRSTTQSIQSSGPFTTALALRLGGSMGTEALRAFWDERAGTLGEEAGTRDRIAKALEIEAIRSFITLDIDTVLDFGCGTGETAVALARDFQVRVIGYDISPKMIEIAKERLRAEPKLEGTVEFVTGLGSGWLLSLPPRIDLAYTERMLQNLPSWEEQGRAIAWLAQVAPPGPPSAPPVNQLARRPPRSEFGRVGQGRIWYFTA